jgi:hypothetical protein
VLFRAAAAYQSATDWHLRRPDPAAWQTRVAAASDA